MAFKLPAIPKITHHSNNYAFLNAKGVKQIQWSELHVNNVIGRGQFGEVSRITYQGKELVSKQLLSQDEEDRRSFLKESLIMKDLNHPNILALKGVCVEKCAILSEYMSFDFHLFGKDEHAYSLEDFWHYIHRQNIVSSFDFAEIISSQMGNALHYMHRNNVAHRDLKTANVLVTNQHYASITDQSALQAVYAKQPIITKLADFGESRSKSGPPKRRWIWPKFRMRHLFRQSNKFKLGTEKNRHF